MTVTHFHVLGLNEVISPANGSALLQIARELTEAARNAGDEAFIISSEHQDRDVQISLPLLSSIPARSRRFENVRSLLTGQAPLPHEKIDPSTIEPDVIWLHNRPWDADRFRARFPHARVFLYAHNVVLRYHRASTVRRVLGQFDEVYCVSTFIANDLAKRAAGGLHQKPIVVHSAAPRAHTVKRDEPSGRVMTTDVLYVGRVNKAKGVLDLIRARKKLPGISLVVIGGAWFTNEIPLSRFERRLRRIGEQFDPPVRFTGALPPADIEHWRAVSRVTVIPSRWHEPLGLTVLEAMRSDSAVVATRSGGIPELARDGGVLLTPRGDPKKLAHAIRFLLEDEAARHQNAAAGKLSSATRSWGAVYDEIRGHLNEGRVE